MKAKQIKKEAKLRNRIKECLFLDRKMGGPLEELEALFTKLLAQELRGLMEEAIAIFEKLPEDEMMTKNPVILELKVLKESIGGEDER